MIRIGKPPTRPRRVVSWRVETPALVSLLAALLWTAMATAPTPVPAPVEATDLPECSWSAEDAGGCWWWSEIDQGRVIVPARSR